MAAEKIGDWTRDRLNKQVQQIIQTVPLPLPTSLEGEELHAFSKLKVSGDLELSSQAVQQLKVYLGLP